MENKKEYGIYIRNGKGTPYMLDIYNNLDAAKTKLYDMIQQEELRERPYYVDNDFFDNKYNIAIKLKYFCIKVRNVTEWEKYEEQKEIQKENDKIINILEYKRKLKSI